MNKKMTWAEELMMLADDFCLDMGKAAAIIDRTATGFPGKSEDWLYDHAWRGIRDLIMES